MINGEDAVVISKEDRHRILRAFAHLCGYESGSCEVIDWSKLQTQIPGDCWSAVNALDSSVKLDEDEQ